jgi:hypothetical protein
VPNALKSESLTLLESLGPVQACNEIALALPFTHLPIQWVLMLKRPKRETDHPPPTVAGVRNDLISNFSVFVYLPDLTRKTLHFTVTVVGSTAFPLLLNLVEKL